MQEDPLIEAIEKNMSDLEDHIRANRAHAEQALYTEALPRILNLFRGFLDAIDSEPETSGQGAYIPIRYQTAAALESLLADLFQKMPDNDYLGGTLYLLLEDLHGITEDQAIEAILEKDQKEQKDQPQKEDQQEENQEPTE